MKSSSHTVTWRAGFGIALLTLCAGCNGSDRFQPIDVGAVPAKGDVLIGRVENPGNAPELIGRVNEPVGYVASANPAAEAPMTALSPMAGEGAVYAAAEPQSLTDAADQEPAPASASLAIPQHGVNMDAGLGLGVAPGEDDAASGSGQGVQPQIVTDTGAMAIAEGRTAHPVVDGIGFDEPVQVAAGLPDSGEVSDVADGTEPGLSEGASGGEGEILPLSVDSGNTGMEASPVMRAKPQADCSLYLDKRNCPQG